MSSPDQNGVPTPSLSNPVAAPETRAPRSGVPALALLTGLNLLGALNFAILQPILPRIRQAFDISPHDAGWLAPLFYAGLAFGAVATAFVGDRTRRPRLLALGILVWSVAGAASGRVASLGQLALMRVLLGVGEGVFSVVALTLLMDRFPWRRRATAAACFMMTFPLAALVGFIVANTVANAIDWRTLLLILALPGFPAALALLWTPDPLRGECEGIDPAKLRLHELHGASREDYIDLMVNSSYTYSVLGLAFATFTLGGLTAWMPTYLFTTRAVAPERVGALLGFTTLAAVLGMAGCAILTDSLARRAPRSFFVAPGLAMFGAVPCLLAMLYAPAVVVTPLAIFLTIALVVGVTGPCLAIIANVAMPNMRAAAFGVALCAIHVLGDLWSPPLIAWVADTFSQTDAMSTVFGRGFQWIGAVPTRDPNGILENWTAGLLVVVPALVLGGCFFLAGARHLPREMALMLAKLKASPRHAPGMGAAAATR